jgi:hypothetical protein
MAKLNWENAGRYRSADKRQQRHKTQTTKNYDLVADGIMPFGKYKYYAVVGLPQPYLEWACANNAFADHPIQKKLDDEFVRRYYGRPHQYNRRQKKQRR